MPYRIAGWSKEQGSEHPYEPPTREVSGDGPLKWVRSYVWGHSLSDAYRTLLEVDHLHGLAAFGVFHKLLEIAADEPRQLRDGTLYRHSKPATLKDLAFLLGVSVETAEPMISALIGVGWLVQTTEPVEETTEAVKQTTEPVDILTGGAEKRRTDIDLDIDIDVDGDIDKEGDARPLDAASPTDVSEQPEPPATKKERPRDPIWDAVCEVFSWTEVPKSQRTSVGAVVRDLKTLGATPDEIRIRTARMRAAWDGKPFSPQAVVKWWTQYASESAAWEQKRRGHQGSGRSVRERAAARGEYPEPQRACIPNL